jgi:hypothetical protein
MDIVISKSNSTCLPQLNNFYESNQLEISLSIAVIKFRLFAE